jgi:glutamine cyclotransferase
LTARRAVLLAAILVVGLVAYRLGTAPDAPADPPPTVTVGSGSRAPVQEPVPVHSFEVVAEYPHDPEAFTQGLVFYEGDLFEGTGLYGHSSVRHVDLETGAVNRQVDLEARYFGEGITLWNDRILQITWKEQQGFVYDRDTFERTGEFTYTTEGWGLTHDGHQLYMSDGTATITLRDPDTLASTGTIQVHDGGVPVRNLNELEYVGGELYANLWLTDRIAIIDPATGQVQAYVDLAGLLDPADRGPDADVLNGIAYDSAGNRLFVTGKKWPKVFEIRLVPPRIVRHFSLLPFLANWPLANFPLSTR